MGDFRTKCSVCGKTIRVQTGTKKRRCVNCDFIDLATKMKREPRRASENKESRADGEIDKGENDGPE